MTSRRATSSLRIRLKRLLYTTFPIWIAIVLAVSIVVPAQFLTPCGEVFDNPWKVGLTLVRTTGRHFGTDFIFTYGPLGVLGSRMRLPSEYLPVLVMDMYLLTHLTYVLVALFGKRISIAATAILLTALFATSGQLLGEEQSMTLLVLNLFSTALFLHTKSKAHLFLAGTSSMLAMFTKVSAGFVSCGFFGAALLVDAVHTRNLTQLLKRALLYAASLLLVARLLNVDLVQYVRTALPIITGYDEAMMLPLPLAQSFPYVVTLCLLIYLRVIWSVGVAARQSRETLPVLALSLLFTFVLFKQAFTRADPWHIRAFFMFLPLSLGIFLIPLPAAKRGRLGIPVAGFALACFLLHGSWTPPRQNKTPERFLPILGYFSSMLDYPKVAECVFHTEAPLSEEMLATIGESTVDSIPHDVAPVFNAKLNYRSRPIIMGYSTYDRFLDGLNAQFFRSEKAPQYIIYSPEAIDSRHPFADEARMKLAILEWYDVLQEDPSTRRLLLKRRPIPRRVEVKEIGATAHSLSDTIEIPKSSNPIMAQVDIRYTMAGKAQGILAKYPILYLQLETAPPTTPSPKWKTIKRTLTDGFIVSPYVHDSATAKRFFSPELPAKDSVARFSLSASNPAAIESPITVRFFEILTHE
jgi:hypothetical protein